MSRSKMQDCTTIGSQYRFCKQEKNYMSSTFFTLHFVQIFLPEQVCYCEEITNMLCFYSSNFKNQLLYKATPLRWPSELKKKGLWKCIIIMILLSYFLILFLKESITKLVKVSLKNLTNTQISPVVFGTELLGHHKVCNFKFGSSLST